MTSGKVTHQVKAELTETEHRAFGAAAAQAGMGKRRFLASIITERLAAGRARAKCPTCGK